ncbi:hypothetical protein BHE74_00055881 [Ensete ventricosum]|nr:hypothetical protein BHE74_00055881 [Ensete ventricosum]
MERSGWPKIRSDGSMIEMTAVAKEGAVGQRRQRRLRRWGGKQQCRRYCARLRGSGAATEGRSGGHRQGPKHSWLRGVALP